MADGPKRTGRTPQEFPIVEKSTRTPAPGRDLYGPKSHAIGRMPTSPSESWDEDSTPPTTDPALYRAIRSLKGEVKDQAVEIGAITTQVAVITARASATEAAVRSIDEKQDAQSSQLSTISGQLGMMIDERHQMMRTTETRMIAQSTTRESLAEQVLKERRDDRRYKQRLYLKIAGGVFSTATITALITVLASKC